MNATGAQRNPVAFLDSNARRPDYRTIPLALYIHIPWCEKKCPYCDFNSHAQAISARDINDYKTGLLRDAKASLNRHPHLARRPLHSIFIGGGTPSLLDGSFYAELLDAFARLFTMPPTVEITLESNPGSAEQKRFKEYKTCGINRLSLGAQSFDDAMLRRIGRIHNFKDILDAYDLALQAGLQRINLDLMYGLPQQSVQQALEDLQKAIDLAPEHLSWYQLTLEPGTPFYVHPPDALPEEDQLIRMEQQGKARLGQAGLKRYEVSAYARAAQFDLAYSTHNMNYWQFGDYLGLGAGAHSKLTLPDGSIRREWRKRGPTDYMRAALHKHLTIRVPRAGTLCSDDDEALLGGWRVLTEDDKTYEFMLNALRLTDGFATELFQRRTGLPPHTLDAMRATAIAKGLLVAEDGCFCPTERGLAMLNDLILLFAPQAAEAQQVN